MEKVCTAAQRADGCVPGCAALDGTPNWCAVPAPISAHLASGAEPTRQSALSAVSGAAVGAMKGADGIFECAWRPDDTAAMLAFQAIADFGAQYDEVVIDAGAWAQSLPDGLEAFFYRVGEGSAKALGMAAKLHAAFRARYPDAHAPLLLSFDGTHPTEPFMDETGEERHEYVPPGGRPWEWDHGR